MSLLASGAPPYFRLNPPSGSTSTRRSSGTANTTGYTPVYRCDAIWVRTPYLYLSDSSLRAFGSRVFRIPSSVLLTASVAPIMGFKTAIGTARTTAFSGP